MAHELKRIAMKYVNRPQLMAPSAFEAAMDYLSERNSGEGFELISRSDIESSAKPQQSIENGVGFISIEGPLFSKKLDAQPVCGPSAANYESIQEDFDRLLASPETSTIVLDIDSNGGSAYGAFSLSNYMREKADAVGITLLAYIDGMAASAGYVLASAAHEIIMNPYAEAGSIGVVVRLQNTNKMKQKMGVEETYIYAGDSKVPFNTDGSFQEEFLEDIQAKVYKLYDSFVQHVVSLRPLTEGEVRGTQAKTFDAEQSIKMGLADKALTVDEFLSSYLPSVVENKGIPVLLKSKTETKEFQENMSENSEVDNSAVETLAAELAAAKEAIAQLEQEKEVAKLAEVEASLSQLSFLEDSGALAKLVVNIDKEQAELIQGSLQAAEDKIAVLTAEVEEAKAELEKDMFVKTSVEGDSEPDKDLSVAEARKESAAKYFNKSK